MNQRTDLASSKDVERLVDMFYALVQADECLGPIFNDVAQVDWDTHLPKMYAFWESMLFGSASFKGNPLAVHRALALQTQLTHHEFDRWLELFHGSVDELFAGPVAEEAKQRATRIAMVLQHHIASDQAIPARMQ